jgi:hypothetical protein
VDNYEDIDWDKDNNRDNKASNAKLLAVAAVEQTQQRRNVRGRVASSVAFGQTPARLKQ